MTRWGQRLRDLAVGVAMLILALLIIAKLENQQALRFFEPFSVIDGDTLLADGERLRIEGVDAPEIAQTCSLPDGSVYGCGEDARRNLRAIVVAAGWECSGVQRDRYHRLLVICRRGQNDLGALLVASGFAVADGRYFAEEALARQAKKGLWSGSFERPADWRRIRKVEEAEHAGWLAALVPRLISDWFKD